METGISYQVRDLVLDLIVNYEDDLFKDKSKDEKKQFRKEDDILYGKLAEKNSKSYENLKIIFSLFLNYSITFN